MDTESPFTTWLAASNPGEVFRYAISHGTLFDKDVSDHTRAEAELAKQSFARWEVELAQKRVVSEIEGSFFAYRATKRKLVKVYTVNGSRWLARILWPY